MRKQCIAPAAAILAGLLGALLRWIELQTAFDDISGLAERWKPVSVALMILSVLTVICSLAYAGRAGKGKKGKLSYCEAFYNDSPVSLIISVIFGTAVIAAALAYRFLPAPELSGTALDVFTIFAVFTGISFLSLGIAEYRHKDDAVLCLTSVIPALFFCFWMAVLYKVSAGNPSLLSYCYGCIAFGAAAVGFYFAAGFVYGRTNWRAALATQLTAIYFLTVILTENRSVTLKVIIVGTVGFFVQNTARLIAAPEPERPESADAESGNQDI